MDASKKSAGLPKVKPDKVSLQCNSFTRGVYIIKKPRDKILTKIQNGLDKSATQIISDANDPLKGLPEYKLPPATGELNQTTNKEKVFSIPPKNSCKPKSDNTSQTELPTIETPKQIKL
ncbi:MAG: hypothetical protein M1561_01655 [Gammaproteobacteria bacterium]|nr:hypothetical protein [Gammaproteobacteria bacterium]